MPVGSVDELRESRAMIPVGRDSNVIVVQADRLMQPGFGGMADLAGEPVFASSRFVALADHRGAAPLELPNALVVSANPLSRSRFIAGVAVAAGRASPDVRDVVEPVSPIVQRKTPSIEEAAERGELILVAEDNLTNQDVIRRQLNRLGYAVQIVGNGVEALAALDAGSYAMLLTDCHMPGMDGYALTEAIRSRETGGTSRLPVVAITANAMQGEAERCLAAGMDAYLTKPIEMGRLRQMVERWMPSTGESVGAVAVHAVPVSGTACVLDGNVLKELFGEDEETIREILKEFPEPSETIVTELLRAHSMGDPSGIAAAAHKLKSSARAIGALALADLCVSLEASGRVADWAALDAEVPKLSPLMRAVSNYIAGL